VHHPIEDLDVLELFFEVKEYLKGRVTADSFTDLSPSHKRFCLYWWYAMNMFGFGGGEAQKLPNCLTEAISKEERVAEASKSN
jgi:hypothetical protein